MNKRSTLPFLLLVLSAFFVGRQPPSHERVAPPLPTKEALANGLEKAAKPSEFFFAPYQANSRAAQEEGVENALSGENKAVRRSKAISVVRTYLQKYASRYHLNPDTLSGARLRHFHDTGNGPMIAKFNQYVGEREIFRNELNVMIRRDGSLVAISGYLSAHVAKMEEKGVAHFQSQVDRLDDQYLITAEMAISKAFERMGGESHHEAWSLHHSLEGYDFYSAPMIQGAYRLRSPARLKKVLFDAEDGLKAAYYIELVAGAFDSNVHEAYAFVVSATDGHLLFRNNLVTPTAFSYRVYADSTEEHRPMDGPLGNAGTPYPLDHLSVPVWWPEAVSQNLVSWQNGPIQSKDPWLPPRATTTRGNNARAYTDRFYPEGHQADKGDLYAEVNAERTFDYLYDPNLGPMETPTQSQATIVQLFYVVNYLHDWFYDFGFDEASGNAQQDNFGRGGQAGDPLLAEAQDYDDLDNARITVPADGASPRMEMFLWRGAASVRVVIHQPTMDPLPAGYAVFGPSSFQLAGTLVRMDDGTEPMRDGCSAVPLPALLHEKIVLIDRGDCYFEKKVRLAQAAGAAGVLIANNVEETALLTMSGEALDITIPALFIQKKAGQALDAALLDGPVEVTLFRQDSAVLSGAMDALIVAHEWGHLISNRLIGNANGLNNKQGKSLGEGWADFHALLLAVREQDTQVTNNDHFQGTYAIGSYAISLANEDDPYYFGLRRLPYSVDFDKNALTFKYIENDLPLPEHPPHRDSGKENAEPHAAGEVWASALWDVYAALLRDNERLSFVEAQRRMTSYLVASYKMTPLDPTFTEARDALLSVALANDPTDYFLMQKAFARRGLGTYAQSPDRHSTDNFGVRESFTVHTPWSVVRADLDTSLHACDQDEFLDVGESARLILTLRNDNPALLPASHATLTTTGKVHFSKGDRIELPAAQPGETVQVRTELTLESANLGEVLQIEMTPHDPWAGQRQEVWRGQVHMDLEPAFTLDTVEKMETIDWHMGHGSESADATWMVRTLDEGGQVYWGEDPDHPAEIWLESPSVRVAENRALRLQFEHSYAFEMDEDGAWDGAVLEVRVMDEEEAPWQDLGTAMQGGGYSGTILASNPVLGGRQGFVGNSPGYPAFITETVLLDEGYQGKEVRFRFRIASDQYVGNTGWMVRNIRFENSVNLPFTAVVDNVISCETPSVPDVEPKDTHRIKGVLRGLKAGDTARLIAYAPSIGHRTSMTLLGGDGDLAFTFRGLPVAPDYQLQVTAEKYQDGYWGGISGGQPLEVVAAFHAMTLDLSAGEVSGINLQLTQAYTLDVILGDVQEGDRWEVTSWSQSSGGLAWREQVAQGREIPLKLTGLPGAADYRLYARCDDCDFMSGFYTGEGLLLGSLLQAEPLQMDRDRTVTLKASMGRRILGQVSNHEGADAWVSAWSEERAFGAVVDLDSAGAYALTGLAPARDYRICVTAETLMGGCYGGHVTVPYGLAIPVDVTVENRSGIHLVMEKGQHISGQVTGLAEGVYAWVEAWSAEAGHWRTAQSQADGYFILEGLPRAKDYQISATAQGYRAASQHNIVVGEQAANVSPEEATESTLRIHFEPVPDGRMEGTIRGLQRRALVTLRVHSLETGVSREITLQANDSQPLLYALDGLADAQDYTLQIQSPHGLFFWGEHGWVRHWPKRKMLSIASGETIRDLDFTLGMKESYRLSGTVSSEVNTPFLVTVTAWSEAGDFGSSQRVGSGHWSISGLGPGDYRLAVQAAGHVKQFFSGFSAGRPLWHIALEDAKDLPVQADREDLDLMLVAGHTITGMVVDSQATPVKSVRVGVWDSSQNIGGNAMTLADGRFEITGMASGQYQFEINSQQGTYQASLPSLTTNWHVGTITLSKQEGAIHGAIKGAGAAHALLLLYANDGTYVTATVTDENGYYSIDNLPTASLYRLDIDTNHDLKTIEGTATINIDGLVKMDLDLADEEDSP